MTKGELIGRAKDEYEAAQRQAKRSSAQAASEGKSGYLPSLEGILEYSPIYAERHVGMETVPLHKIVGTSTQNRARSFAPGFLPLPRDDSEFAAKWIQVYAHQMEHGITDPIDVREYLNWFWVVEGNKRVSVLKDLGAFEIEANVTRLLPKPSDDDPAVQTYFRFLPFKEKTGLYDIWIRDPAGYERLLDLIDSSEFGELKEPKRYNRFYRDLYLPFRTVLKELGGDNLPFTTAEALLRYIEIAGFPSQFSEEEHRGRLEEVIKELSLRSDEIGITTEPVKPPGRTILSSIGQLMRPGKPLHISFVHYGNPSISEWTMRHEEARRALQTELPGRVRTNIFWAEDPPSSFQEVIREAAEGADVVFSTAALLYDDTRKVAVEKPNVRFFVASREKSGVHVRTYSPRTHETHFLSGMIAGALARENPIGFILSNYSAYAFALVNAFTLGAQGVDRDARVKLVWNDKWFNDYFDPALLPPDLKEGEEFFFHNVVPPLESGFRGYGLYSYHDGTFTKYADLIYDWREFYLDVVKNILAGNTREFQSDAGEQARFLTFWGGLRTGILDFRMDPERVTPGVRRVVEGMKRLIVMDEFPPFSGPIYDTDGNERLPHGEVLDYDGIISMDYLVQGVEGPEVDFRKVITS